MDNRNIAIIVLAAGNSSRLGRSKQLLTLNNGVSLLNSTVISALDSSANQVLVVLGANYHQHFESLSSFHSKIDIVNNTHWERGMGSSIKAGIQELTKINTKLDGIIISVCDQFFLQAEQFNRLISSYAQHKLKSIVASRYNEDNFGVPVLFKKQHFNELERLQDHIGALKIVKQHLNAVEFVVFEKGEIDIDVKEDYECLVQNKLN